MTHDAGPDRPGGAGDGNLRALLWFVADCVVTVLFTAALWQASYAGSEELLVRDSFLRIVPLMMLLFVNGARRLIRNYHRRCFQRLPVVQCVAAPWVVAMSYIQVWCVASTGSDLPDNPNALYFVAAPMTVGAGLAYTMLAGKLRGVANPDKEGDAQRSSSQSWQTTPQEPISREPDDVTDDQPSSHSADQDAEASNGSDDGDPYAVAWFVADCVLTALLTTALWQASYAKGDDGVGPSSFLGVMPPMLLLLVNGLRRVVRNYHLMTFQGSPLVQCVVALWVAVMFYLYAWSVDSTGWGAMIAPMLVYVAALPLAVCAGLLYASLDATLRRAVRVTPVVAVEATDEARATVVERVSPSTKADSSYQRYSLTRRARRRDSIRRIPATLDTDLHSPSSREQGSSADKARSPTQSTNLRATIQSYFWISVVLLFVTSSAMYNRASTAAKEGKGTTARFNISLTPMDYEPTDTYVQSVYIDGGGVESAGTGGSTVLSAFSLPVRWHPGLTVRVKWQRCKAFYADNPQTEEQACRWVEKDVPVHPYTDVGSPTVHLFADDEVLVIPSMMTPRHEDYAGAPYPYKNFYEKRGIGHDE